MLFCANDAALAVDKMTEEASNDISFESRTQFEADFARVSNDVRNQVLNVMKIHGLTQLGNKDDGTEDGAEKVIDAVRSYAADPAGYVTRVFPSDGPSAPSDAAEEVSAAVEAPPPSPTAFEQAAKAPVIDQPTGKIRFVPRPAGTLFAGLNADYANDLVPTAVWETPKPVILDPDPDYHFSGYQVALMAMAIEERKNVIATGDPGCGKTEFFKQFGSRIGLPVNKIPFDGNLTRAEIIGSFRQIATPTGSETPFVLGLIPRLIQQPGIIVLDEIDQADPDIMYMLHPVFEGEGLTIQEEGGIFIPRHEHCYIVATANTKGRGSDTGLTHARHEMSEATRDRFPYWLNFTFMKEDAETKTIVAKTGLAEPLARKLVQVANQIRTAYSTGEISQTCSLRQMLDVAPVYRRFSSRGDLPALALGIDAVMIGRANTDDANGIREWVKQSLNVDLETIEL